MTTLLLVAAASAVGAPARFLLDQAIATRIGVVFPWGTWVVNVSGAFALGLLTGLAQHHGVPKQVVAAVGTGLLGAYTTFSTFTYETVRLLQERAYLAAAANVVATMAVGCLAGGLGLALGHVGGF